MWCYLTAAYLKCGLIEEALICFEQVLALAPNDHEELMGYSETLHDLGRLEEALAALAKAEEFLPSDDSHRRAQVFVWRGRMLCNAGRHMQAEAAFAQALALMPDDANAWWHRAINAQDSAQIEAGAGHRGEARRAVGGGNSSCRAGARPRSQ